MSAQLPSDHLPFDHPPLRTRQTGLLLVNLGTPPSLEVSDIRAYLKEFLSDRRVIDYSPWLWQPILRGIILNVRPRKTREAYKKIWRKARNESPLRYYTRTQAEKLAERLADTGVMVDWAMNYGKPSIHEKLNHLVNSGCHQVLILPLYPQYSASTTGSVCDRVFDALKAMQWQPAIRTLDTWHDDPLYIDACVAQLKSSLAELSFVPETLILSFHGLPQRYLTQGDPYHCFCLKSGRLMAERLGRDDINIQTTFQSRFGPEKWLEPYTDKTIQALAEQGTKRVAVFSPGFVSDCVETLEELGIALKETFEMAGGEDFAVLPCLNDAEPAIDMLEGLARRELAGWVTSS